jgi:membrane associated rhomboid family serine protease
MFRVRREFSAPVCDQIHVQTQPISTLALIVVNIIVYVITSYESFFMEISDYWVNAGGFVPFLITIPSQFYRIFLSMFLHADIFHILFNMYYLYLFGRAVELALGKWRFLALYIISGISASIFHTAFSFLGGVSAYVIPAIGASGAISGVLGAYLILFPGTSLIMGRFFIFFPIFFRIKAAYYLLFWFATQLIYGYAIAGESVAFFAHVGGFIAGIALLPLVASRERIIEFRIMRRFILPFHIVLISRPKRKMGLSMMTKAILATLLVSIIFGAAYASSGLSIKSKLKAITIQYSLEGASYIDYAGLQIPDIEDQISSISQDATRILLSRFYAAGLLYNASKANENGHFVWNGELKMRVKVGLATATVNVPTTINFYGEYDADGFLKSGRGNLTTCIITISPYSPYTVDLSSPVNYIFDLNSQTVNLASITQLAGVVSLLTTAAALIVSLTKDKYLTLVGEEPEKPRVSLPPYI